MNTKIKFCGAAGTVTGSCHLIELGDGKKILLDCGLYQGNDSDYDEFNAHWPFSPKEIDAVVLSHAHIDHSGRLPKLVKDGYKGNIYCTSATRDLASIMLIDSAFLQEKDAVYQNKWRKKKEKSLIEPLYTVKDAKKSLEGFVGIGYSRWFQILDNVDVKFEDSGHILGSASVIIRIKMNDGYYKYIGFSGDIGRPNRPILRDPKPMEDVDYLICESTYGGKEHEGGPNEKKKLLEIINSTCIENRGKLIIPAFSVGRTQEIVYMLDQMDNEGILPSIPVYVDSPMAIDATEVFLMHPECFDDDLIDYIASDPNPFGFRRLIMTRNAEQSKKLNYSKEACIIISASGMMSGGRIIHHLYHHIENKRNTILVVGYCAYGTLGREIRDGADYIEIFGDRKKVGAKVEIMDSFSAHGDQSEMIDFLNKTNKHKLKKIFLVHGDYDRQEPFEKALLQNGFRSIEKPKMYQEFNLDF